MGLFMVITMNLVQVYKMIYGLNLYYEFNVSIRVRKSVKLNWSLLNEVKLLNRTYSKVLLELVVFHQQKW